MRGRNRKGPNPLTRTYESNGPDVKIRGTAQHVAEKYAQLSRDSQASGDPVSAENYLQHAEHYYRIIAAAQAQFQQTYGTLPRFDDERDDGEGDDGFGYGSQQPSDYGAPQPDLRGGYDEQPYAPAPPYQARQDRGERQDRGDRQDRPERNDRYERNDRVERSDRPAAERQDRNDRPERNDRQPERNDRQPRAERNDRPDRGERQERAPDRGERQERAPERGERQERAPERAERTERPERGDRRERFRGSRRNDEAQPGDGGPNGQGVLPAFLTAPLRQPASEAPDDIQDQAETPAPAERPRAPRAAARSSTAKEAPVKEVEAPAPADETEAPAVRTRRPRKVAVTEAEPEAPVAPAPRATRGRPKRRTAADEDADSDERVLPLGD